MGTPTSLERIKKLVDHLRDIKGPLVVAGDFNLKPESEAIQYIVNELELTDLTAQAGLTNTLENSLTEYKAACDHILVSKHIKVNEVVMSDALLSDHKALVLDFEVK